MDQGNLNVELAKLEPARSKNPFLGIENLADYKNADSVKIDAEEESAGNKTSNANVEMGGGTARPERLKCLHAHAAFALARPGYELGERIVAEVEPLWPDRCCTD